MSWGESRDGAGSASEPGRVFAIVNQKGGVGKTTTAVNLAASLAASERATLLVDLDPQANASSAFGVSAPPVQVYDVICAKATALDAIAATELSHLHVLPAGEDLSGAEIELVGLADRQDKLRAGLAPVLGNYDYILIDCPPSLGILTVNGLVAARDGVLVPVQCEYLALEGLGQLTRTIERVRSSLFPDLRVRGVILTMFDPRTNLSTDVVNEVKNHFPGLVFESIVPRSIRLAEAPSYGLPISAYSPASVGARSYEALAKELLKGDGVMVT
jgi:chromosome partitioning protein